MKIYEALYNPMIHESGWVTLSLHKSEKGAENAIKNHRYNEMEDFKKMYPTKDDEPFDFGTFQKWRVGESELLP